MVSARSHVEICLAALAFRVHGSDQRNVRQVSPAGKRIVHHGDIASAKRHALDHGPHRHRH
jgi:hypothetical protein